MSIFLCTFADKKYFFMKTYAVGLLPSKLHKLRKQCKHTQRELANLLGVSVAMYSKIELGERTVKADHIPKLAHFFNSDVNEFYTLYLADKIKSESKEYPRQVIDKALNLIQHELI